MAGPSTAAAPAVHPAVFRQATKPDSVPAGSIVVNAFGGLAQSVKIPHTGWLSRLLVYFNGTLTTGAGTPTGAWVTYPPFPWNLIGNILVATDTNTQIVNMSGYGLYLFNRYYRRTNLPDVDLDGNYNSTNRAALVQFPAVGAPTASTVYNVAGYLEIPVATDDSLFLGALFLQSDQVTLNVTITPPTQAAVAGTIGGVTVTPAITYAVQAYFFEQPTDLRITPNKQFVHSLNEQNRAVPGTGQQMYPLPLGNTYLKVFGQLENNSLQAVNSAITSLLLSHTQIVSPVNEGYNIHLANNKCYLANTLPDGSFLFDFSRGSGIPGFYEGRDFLNSSLTTDLQIGLIIPAGTTLTNPNLRLMSEQLQAIGTS